jgi:ubiquinone/menaquinone biosynthesis C-methylase UbiE
MTTTEEAFKILRLLPEYQTMMHDSYLDSDVLAAAERFAQSSEFAEVQKLLSIENTEPTILDLGAGNGIASYAFAKTGNAQVIAVEPDPSQTIGYGAIQKLCAGLPVSMLAAYGEALPLPDECVDVVYVRQVLHHIRHLEQALAECYRILRPNGIFLACREHVVSNNKQLAKFLQHHPVHQLAQNENAYRLDQYTTAIRQAGFGEPTIFRTWDSIINAFPFVSSTADLAALPQKALSRRFGSIGKMLGEMAIVRKLIFWRLNRPVPGRMYTFLAKK